MIKVLSIVVSLSLVFVSSVFFEEAPQVSILPSVPSEVKPGDSFLVELTIHKDKVKGFANLQQYLPEGFTASPVNSNRGSFSFKNQLVRFIWIELPGEKSFKITYQIKTDETCSGVKTLTGEFSFMENNTTNKIAITPSVVLMNNDFVSPDATNGYSASTIVDKSMVPSEALSGGYDVTLKVKKGFQKINVQLNIPLPDGYVAEAINTHGSKFSYRERFAEFYWKTLPPDSVFNVSYHIYLKNPISGNTSQALQAAENTTGSITQEKESVPAEFSMSFPKKNETVQAAELNSNGLVPLSDVKKGIYYKIQIAATRKSPDRNNDFFISYWNIKEPVDMTMEEGWKKYLIGTFEKYSAANQFGMATRTKIPDAFVVTYHSGVRIPLQEARKINQ